MLPERLFVDGTDKRRACDSLRKRILVDQTDVDDRRILLPRQFRVRIDVIEQMGGKRFQIPHSVFIQECQRFEFGRPDSPVGIFRDLPLFQRTGAEEIERGVDSPLPTRGQLIVQFVQTHGIQFGGSPVCPFHQLLVEMVETDQVVSGGRQFIEHPVGEFFLHEIGFSHVVDSPEADGDAGPFLKLEMIAGDPEKSILSGRLVQQIGKVDDASRKDVFAIPDRVPVRVCLKEERRADFRNDLLVGQRCRRDHPDGVARASERDLPDRLP